MLSVDLRGKLASLDFATVLQMLALGEAAFLFMGYVTPETLAEVICQQVQEAVSELFFWKEGYFEHRDCLVAFDERTARKM